MENLKKYKLTYFISRKDAKKPSLRHKFLCVKLFVFLFVFVFLWQNASSQRKDISLNNDWYSIATSNDQLLPADTYQTSIDHNWKKVNVPHNWDQYEGYRRLLHGNRHGDSWYRKTFAIKQAKPGKRFFLFFEGVGSYATVYLNNKKVGEHAGGRTTFTIDVTEVLKTDGTKNSLAVRAYHPSNIKDLPWVCGGCSDERGFSEGSQPMGIFRPVHLIITNNVRVEPFGVHAWADISANNIQLNIAASIKNYSQKNRNVIVEHRLIDATGKEVSKITEQEVKISNVDVAEQKSEIANLKSKIKLWSVENPYLYKIITIVKENNIVLDQTETEFGFRTIKWNNPSHQFTLNGKPVFINGIAEYEHLLGQSHAFSNEQIMARFKWLQSAGFNAFRDGHQPHNLLYGQLCDEKGILWWTQLSAHVWYDSPEFRKNFKQLLKEWIIERRNSPSIILWGLQNESKLPEDFAKECTELIRSLDPTASTQRLVTTCNGGTGTDWDVPQNWTGTYGGDPNTYADDVKKQILVGEYGAWRAIDLHTEGGFVQNGPLSEDRFTQLMEKKIRLAESVKDSSAGQFFWLLTSHDNPGRVQGGEGLRELDRIGPVNYKGLLTPWEEPTDAYYMYRSNYAPKETQPMVYIVSHTWPNRWMKPGIKDSIIVYSNCDEVELFNDVDGSSLGKRKKNGIGTHFQWDKVNIHYNVLYAVGYVKGKVVAKDVIVLNHLAAAPGINKLLASNKNLLKGQEGYYYKYRINCGGPDYIDSNGNEWDADRQSETEISGHGSVSWSDDYEGMPSFFASQRRTFSPIKNTNDWKLFQSFRYGKHKLKFEFDIADGEYLVELYFIEPWLGIGGGINAKGMRLFDVAINGRTVINDLDIWNEAGTNAALKKTVIAKSVNGKLIISFPESKAGEAVISAIAIAKKEKNTKGVRKEVFTYIIPDTNETYLRKSWLDIGDKQFAEENVAFNSLPSVLFGADWLQFNNQNSVNEAEFKAEEATDVYIALNTATNISTVDPLFEPVNENIITDEDGGKVYKVYRRRLNKGELIRHIKPGYIFAFTAASNMQPAYDLKPINAYKTNVAVVSDGVVKDSVNGRFCAVVKTNTAASVQWPIKTGVGDYYSVTVKYYYPNEKVIKGKLLLLDAGGNRMMDETVEFTFTRSGKWNQFTVNTKSQINAGNYTVKIELENGESLAFSGIEIQ